jgi:hypothetical protein
VLAIPFPAPPVAADRAVFGAPVVRPCRVSNELSAEPSEVMREQMNGELLDRYSSAGGLPKQLAARSPTKFGPAPTRQVRR